MSSHDAGWIVIRGARQHNLKNIDVALPRNRLVVITGPSGAGKSSLAFDTLYAEGQRRYVESLSPSTRQFLTQLEKPDVDAIDGLGPAIAIEQRVSAASPRSTVGTVSDIHDFLRLLYARVATPHCYRCGVVIQGHSVQQVVDRARAEPGQPRLLVCAPQPPEPEADWEARLERWRREGFVRIRVDGEPHRLEDAVPPPAGEPEAVDIVVDRLSLANPDPLRLTEAVEQAYHFGHGLVRLVFQRPGEREPYAEALLSRTPRCPRCGITYPEPHPRLFSFNGPYGACPQCHGLGSELSVDVARVVPEPERSLAEGALAPWAHRTAPGFQRMLEQVAHHYGFSILDPFAQLSEAQQQVILHGSGSEALEFTYEGDGTHHRYTRPFEGVIPNLERRYRETASASVREDIRGYMSDRPCRACAGERLRVESRHFLLGGRSLPGVSRLPLSAAREWVEGLALEGEQARVAARLVEEVGRRLGFLVEVGLHYLALERTMDTLSSGEAQRIVLATQIGSALSGVIYILDEPTIGLHPRDTARLLGTLRTLRDTGNTVVVVEHDRETLAAADHLVEIGPHAGEAGGRLVAAGTPRELMADPDSLTGAYLAGRWAIPLPERRREPGGRALVLRGAHAHNLKHLDVEIPLGRFVCVTGVSGSGKSSLVLDTLRPALQQRLQRPGAPEAALAGLEGVAYLERVAHVNQAPIGKSSRSNPGTYLGVFGPIRELFAATREARARGYAGRRFSFNVPGGRCEACQGDGVKRIEMHFLPDVYVRCDVCEGRRFNRETLEIRYRGRTVAEVLEMTVNEAERFFQAIPAIRSRLMPMLRVGLGYLRLGQAANTLSGGEAQRLKIARELGRRETGRTLYILDEPTTGLHASDVERLLGVLDDLVVGGNSVVVIEHNMEMVKCADHVIDLGPEGGDDGGRLVAAGTPEAVAAHPASHTGHFLRDYLEPAATAGAGEGAGKGKVFA